MVATTVEELGAHESAWSDFSKRQLEDNIYVSFPWLLATLRHYGHAMSYQIVFVYRYEGLHRDLVGVAPFSLLAPTLLRPLPAICTLVSPHGYLSHPALDREYAEEALRALWDWLDEPSHPWRVVIFTQLPDRSPVWKLVRDEGRRRKRRIWIKYAVSRSMLRPVESFESYLASLSRSRRRSYRRLWRKLEAEHGAEVRLHRDLLMTPDLADRFMELEAGSWKGKEGTALASAASGRRFFEEIIDRFDDLGALFCVEMVVQGEPIAMTVNFVRGKTLFAFKTAYDPRYGSFSPGILVEVHSVRLFLDSEGLDIGESGTIGDSYIDDYWNDETDLLAVYVPTSRVSARLVLRAIEFSTRLKQRLRRMARSVRRTVSAGSRDR